MTRWIAPLALVLAGTSAFAQSSPGTLDLRVGKLEKEMRAVQRTVFPSGTPVQPDMSPSTPAPVIPGSASNTPVADLTARVDALERQIASLTGAGEQSAFRVRQLEESLARLQQRVGALEGASGGSAGGASAATPATGTATSEAPEPRSVPTARPAAAPTATALVRPAATTKPAPAAAPKPAAAKPDPARRAAVAAIEIPTTGDTIEDEYTYGFRLFTAKLYPEAQTKLKEFVAAHATNRRASYAQNLLGRAYLEEGKPALASVAFYDNYQKMPRGERAAESLSWLGTALIRLKKLPDACKVFDELRDVYGTRIAPDVKARAEKGRTDAKCAA